MLCVGATELAYGAILEDGVAVYCTVCGRCPILYRWTALVLGITAPETTSDVIGITY